MCETRFISVSHNTTEKSWVDVSFTFYTRFKITMKMKQFKIWSGNNFLDKINYGKMSKSIYL